ncbi:MAG: hypothetical protein RLY14_220 [Planctomycetota bacterium]|jgi:predicted esterase
MISIRPTALVSLLAIISAPFLGLCPAVFAQQQFLITMQSGMQLGPGQITEIPSIDGGAFQQQRAGDGLSKPILLLDDELRRTYVSKAQVLSSTPLATNPIKIEIEQVIAPDRANRLVSVGRPMAVTPFNPFGRRMITLPTPTGPLDVYQGITEIGPLYMRVQSLRTEDSVSWDMRISTKSIAHKELDAILRQQLDLTKPQAWFSMERLYSQSERYREARDTLAEAMTRLSETFPGEVQAMQDELKRLEQQFAAQMFREVELRLDAGQPQLASSILKSFPLAQLALETQLKAQDRISDLQRRQDQVRGLTQNMIDLRQELVGKEQEAALGTIIQEISAKLSLNTVDRLSDFNRLKDDKTLSADQRISLAISGWFLGNGSGVDNLAITTSLVEARNLVLECLRAPTAEECKKIADRLKTLESGNAKYVAAILANMAPPLDLPAPVENGPTGLYRIEIPSDSSEPWSYTVQLPPEYDPLRKYPCIVALQGPGMAAEAMIDWWSGPYSEMLQGRAGLASRHGYIVIAPQWLRKEQPDYLYSEQEHHRILKSLRDAMRRLSINTDRIFISGHGIGGNAAWDLALAHPDLWAGVVCIGAHAGKFLQRYRENAKAVPLYFVFGELDGTPLSVSGTELNEYVTSRNYDSVVVSYHGRGAGHFQEELDRIIEWTNLSSHVRKPFPKEINVSCNRAGDRYFWWLEAQSLNPNVIQHPMLYEKNNANQGKIQANILDPGANGVRVVKFPAKNYTVWLHPDMVDFSRTVRIDLEGETERLEITPDISVMIEDARSRAERQHPFWARFDQGPSASGSKR